MKISDKERLDWLTKNWGRIARCSSQTGPYGYVSLHNIEKVHKTPRGAISAAIKSERSERRGRKK